MEKTKEISVFIDESCSFDREDIASRYYLVCLVFHDLAVDLTEHFARFAFFGSIQNLRKSYIKPLARKQWA